MISSRQKRLEKKRKKRRERILRLKRSFGDVRVQHVNKTDDEKQAYVKFIGRDNIKPTNVEEKEEDSFKKIKIIGEKKEIHGKRTDDVVILRKDSDEGESTGEISKKEKSIWQQITIAWKRKWAESLVDNLFKSIFSIGVSIAMLFIGYIFVKNDIQKLKDDISNENGIIRQSLLKDAEIKIYKDINIEIQQLRNDISKNNGRIDEVLLKFYRHSFSK